MSKPTRNADPGEITRTTRTFFVTAKTAMGKKILQSERNATLLIDVLRTYMRAGKFDVHDFVIMPDHVHILLTIYEDTTIERAMQFIKGGFSYRIKKEFGYPHEVWQRGFSDVRVEDRESFLNHREYIAQNPVRAGLTSKADEFPFTFTSVARRRSAGAKALSIVDAPFGTTEVVPFHESHADGRDVVGMRCDEPVCDEGIVG